MDMIINFEYWHWLGLALLLIIVEIVAPGAIFLWFSIAAAIVGIIMLLIPDITWELQWTIFSVLSIGSLFAWRMYSKKNPPADNHYPTLNKRGEDIIDRVFTLEEDIVNNYGKIRVDDTMWKVRGEDALAGSRVRVTAVDGTLLIVENAS